MGKSSCRAATLNRKRDIHVRGSVIEAISYVRVQRNELEVRLPHSNERYDFNTASDSSEVTKYIV